MTLDDDPPLSPRHSLILLHSDELGVVVLCGCKQWGYAGPNSERAWAAFSEHTKEATGHADAEQR